MAWTSKHVITFLVFLLSCVLIERLILNVGAKSEPSDNGFLGEDGKTVDAFSRFHEIRWEFLAFHEPVMKAQVFIGDHVSNASCQPWVELVKTYWSEDKFPRIDFYIYPVPDLKESQKGDLEWWQTHYYCRTVWLISLTSVVNFGDKLVGREISGGKTRKRGSEWRKEGRKEIKREGAK